MYNLAGAAREVKARSGQRKALLLNLLSEVRQKNSRKIVKSTENSVLD